MITWVAWSPRGSDPYSNPKSSVAHAFTSSVPADIRNGGFPLACGRWAPDGWDAIIAPSHGRRCRRCERAIAQATNREDGNES